MEQENIVESSKQLQNEQMDHDIKASLPPANPIIPKNILALDQKASFKIDNFKLSKDEYQNKIYKPVRQKDPTDSMDLSKKQVPKKIIDSEHITLTEEYDNQSLIYKRYDNEKYNKRGNNTYIASIFIRLDSSKPLKLPHYKGVIKDDQLQFQSNFQSGNLLAVYKKKQNEYDLLLQNDVNTNGFTQWYNFRVHNKRHNFAAQFNIVNLYKSQSLYNIGMKPCVHSQKGDRNNKRIWRRKGFNIYYQKNQLSYQDNKLNCYKTLSFQYDFSVESDIVQFAHAMPYDLNDLKNVLENINSSDKVSIKTIGTTIQGRPIPMVKIKSVQKWEGVEKKAIIILARQHPGETVGSFIVQQIMLELLRRSVEIDFLVWRFDIYVFPMVNIDGVVLGNYRSNFAGFDLNRVWLKTDSEKHPQVYAIKNQIRKIKKKQFIELILDLHGHSRKMGSFFYGNNFGTNPMLYPFIASKANNNIVFDDCRFSSEKRSKASTARVVLGNLIKDTGNVYTYEVSFFGNYKNDKTKTISFNEDHYKELGKVLVLSMYRTYMQMYKQEKTLKESVFLKNIKKEIQAINVSTHEGSQSGSDSEAEDAMNNQIKEIQKYFGYRASDEQKIDFNEDEEQIIKLKDKQQYKLPMQKKNEQIKRKVSQLLGRNTNNGQYLEIKGLIKSRFPSLNNQNQPILKQQDLERQLRQNNDVQQRLKQKKQKNNHRLKVYGQTYQLRSRFVNKNEIERNDESFKSIQVRMKSVNKHNKLKDLSKQQLLEKQELGKSFNTINLNQASDIVYISKNLSLHQSKNNKLKNRNQSLQLKEVAPLFNQQLVSQVVKINKSNQTKTNKVPFFFEISNRKLKLPQI